MPMFDFKVRPYNVLNISSKIAISRLIFLSIFIQRLMEKKKEKKSLGELNEKHCLTKKNFKIMIITKQYKT